MNNRREEITQRILSLTEEEFDKLIGEFERCENIPKEE